MKEEICSLGYYGDWLAEKFLRWSGKSGTSELKRNVNCQRVIALENNFPVSDYATKGREVLCKAIWQPCGLTLRPQRTKSCAVPSLSSADIACERSCVEREEKETANPILRLDSHATFSSRVTEASAEPHTRDWVTFTSYEQVVWWAMKGETHARRRCESIVGLRRNWATTIRHETELWSSD